MMNATAFLRLHEAHSAATAPSEIPLTKKFTHIGRATPTIKSEENINEIDCVTLALRIQDADIISRKHATITMTQNASDGSYRYMIADLGSVNGLFVNSRRIKEQVLKDGDIIQFGGRGNLPIGAMIVRPEANIQYVFQLAPDENKMKGNAHEGNVVQLKTESPDRGVINQTTTMPLSSVATHVKILSAFTSDAAVSNNNSSAVNHGNTSTVDATATKRQRTTTSTSSIETPSTTEPDKPTGTSDPTSASAATEIATLKTHVDRLTRKLTAAERAQADGSKRAARELEESEKQLRTLQTLLKKSVDEKTALETQLKAQQAQVASLQSDLSTLKKNGTGKPSPVSPDLVSVSDDTKSDSHKKVLRKYQSYAQGQMSAIDVSALRATLNCRACSQIFVSPVTLLCSHTYCRACIEQEWAKYRCYGVCVTCHDPRDKKHKCSREEGRRRCHYLSSETLDNVIWLLREALSEKERVVC